MRTKLAILTGVLILCTFNLSGQQWMLDLTGTATDKIRSFDLTTIPSGAKVTIDHAKLNDGDGSIVVIVKTSEGLFTLDISDLKKIKLDNPQDQNALWLGIKFQSKAYTDFLKAPKRYDLRHELEIESLESMIRFSKYYGFLNDEYLDDYLQSLLYKIHPITLDDERPGNLFVKVLISNTPNAYSLTNGTIVVTTGLLSLVTTEDELIGVLSHEVAHFVLDHQVDNVLKEEARQKRAEFWAAIATVAAAAGEAYLGAKYDIYTGGQLTMQTAIAASNVATSVAKRMGTVYSQTQEFEADAVAKTVLQYLGKDPLSLSLVLTRMENYFYKTGDYYALSGEGSHPALISRIRALGTPNTTPVVDPNFSKRISSAITLAAMQEYNVQHFEVCEELVDRNIFAGCGTEDDYLIKAMILLKLGDTPESNQLALDYIEKARTVSVNPRIVTEKEAGITLMRLGNKTEANKCFAKYKAEMEAYRTSSPENNNDYIKDEIEWANRMIYLSKLN